MIRSRVLVEISQGRLAIATVRGGSIAQNRSVRFDLGGEDWAQRLEAAIPQLQELVGAVHAQGGAATVFYWSPTAATGFFSCAKSAGRAQALRAARLALADAASYSLQSNPAAVTTLAADCGGRDGEGQCLHSIGIADTEAATQAVMNAVKAAGLNPRELLPLDVPAIALSAQHVLNRSGAPCAALWVGEQGSVLAGASGGRLKFLRQIGIGSESLVAALSREIRSRNGGGEGVTLDPEAARTLLHASGVPARDQAFDERRGIWGDSVLPLLQPVLQRWLVEIKQSLRFGFEEAERGQAVLIGLGGGAAIPRLMDILAEQCCLSVAAIEHPNCDGPIGCWIRQPCPGLTLLPKAMQDQAHQMRLTRGLWVGAAAAGLLITADALLTRAELGNQLVENAALQQRLEAALPATELRDRLIATQYGLAAAQQRMNARMSPVVHWDAALAALASLTPEPVHVHEIRFTLDGQTPLCRITGETSLENSSEVLKEYLDGFSRLPLVSSCRLAATSRGESPAGPVQQFDMQVFLVGMPPQASTSRPLAGVQEAHP